MRDLIGLLLFVALSACSRPEPEPSPGYKLPERSSASTTTALSAAQQPQPETPTPTQQESESAVTSAAVAPEEFKVEFDTTAGKITIDIHKKWAPIGAQRFYDLVESGYFTDIAFFRVVSGFMVQFGIHGDPKVSAQWREKRIKDDPPTQSNTRGRVTFATAGPNTRTTQLFINFGDNSFLDSQGFAPIGEVKDMSAVDKIYSGYGEGAPSGKGPGQGQIQMQGNSYLKASFPKMDYIKSARIVK